MEVGKNLNVCGMGISQKVSLVVVLMKYICTPNTVCYVTHVVTVYKISVVSAHIETHPLSNGNTE